MTRHAPTVGAGQFRAVNVRLIGCPDVIDAATAHLADLHGDAWQPGTRKKSRHGGDQELLYGTLIIPASEGVE